MSPWHGLILKLSENEYQKRRRRQNGVNVARREVGPPAEVSIHSSLYPTHTTRDRFVFWTWTLTNFWELFPAVFQTQRVVREVSRIWTCSIFKWITCKGIVGLVNVPYDHWLNERERGNGGGISIHEEGPFSSVGQMGLSQSSIERWSSVAGDLWRRKMSALREGSFH